MIEKQDKMISQRLIVLKEMKRGEGIMIHVNFSVRLVELIQKKRAKTCCSSF